MEFDLLTLLGRTKIISVFLLFFIVRVSCLVVNQVSLIIMQANQIELNNFLNRKQTKFIFL